jgi:Sec-independent protein translocase protein TatA
MELLGVGLPELAFIVLIALILLGPKDMIAAGRTIGSTLRKIVTSPVWQTMRQTGEELQKLPTKLMREAGLEELQALQNEMQNEVKGVQSEVEEVTRQIQPPDLKKAFDERQVFGPSASISAAQPGADPQPASPSSEPDTPSEPPATPEA